MEGLLPPPAASTALVRPEMASYVNSSIMNPLSSALKRVPVLSMTGNRVAPRGYNNSPSSALSVLPSLPPGATVHMSYTTEGNGFDDLRHTAEKIARDQVTTASERDHSTAKISNLEQTVQLQATKIQKLRSDKSQLQSLLEFEKSTLTKLDFEYRSLETMFGSLQTQMSAFQEYADLASRDSKSFRSTAAALDEKARELEALIANTTDDFHKKEDECLILQSKVDEFEAQLSELNSMMESTASENAIALSARDDKIEELRRDTEEKQHKVHNLTLSLDARIADCKLLESRLESLNQEYTSEKSRANDLDGKYREAKDALTELVERTDAKITFLETQSADLQCQLETALAESSAQAVQYEGVCEDIDKLKSAFKSYKTEAKATVSSLQQTLAEEESAHASTSDQLEALQISYAEFRESAQTEVAQRDQVISELKSSHEKSLADLNANLETAQASLLALKEDTSRSGASHKSDLAELKRKMLGTISEREDSIKQLKAEITAMKKLEKSHNVTIEKAEHDSKVMSDELETTKAKLDEATAKCIAAEEACKSSKTEISDLKKSLKQAKAEYDAARRDFEKSGAKAKLDIKASDERSRKQFEDLQEQLEASNSKLQEILAESTNTKQEIEEKDSEIASLKKLIAETKASRSDKEKEISALKKQSTADLKQVKDEMQKALDMQKVSLTAASATSAALLSEKEAMSAALESKLILVDSQAEEIKKLMKQVAELSREPAPSTRPSNASKISIHATPTLSSSTATSPVAPHKATRIEPKAAVPVSSPIAVRAKSKALLNDHKMAISPPKIDQEEEEDDYDMPSQSPLHSPLISPPESPTSPLKKVTPPVKVAEARADTPIPKKSVQAQAKLPTPRPLSGLNWGAKSSKALPPTSERPSKASSPAPKKATPVTSPKASPTVSPRTSPTQASAAPSLAKPSNLSSKVTIKATSSAKASSSKTSVTTSPLPASHGKTTSSKSQVRSLAPSSKKTSAPLSDSIFDFEQEFAH